MNLRLNSLTLGCLLAALALPTLAQTAGKTGSLGGGTGGGGPVLTRDELRACMKEQTVLAQRRADYEAQVARLKADKDALMSESQSVSGDLGQARQSAARVNEINARATELAKKVDDWNERWQAFEKANRTGGTADRQRRQLIDEQKALAKESAELEAERQGTSTGGVAVASQANARSEALNARTTAWNQRNVALAKAGDDLAQERDLWASECGNRRFREDDEIAIKQGK